MNRSKTSRSQHKSRDDLPPAAIRALKEAAERREKDRLKPVKIEIEINGRKGLEPVRYGDWEKNGIATDF